MVLIVTTPLEQEFQELVDRAGAECNKRGYFPRYFLEMCEQYGTLEATRRLIRDPKISDGMTRLFEMKLLKLSLEALVWDNPKFWDLFDAETIKAGIQKLVQLNYIK